MSSTYSYASQSPIQKNDVQESAAARTGNQFFMKGDTLVYNLSSFSIREDATILDMIGKFPGVSFDGNGCFSVNGKTVSRILVDGKEVFYDAALGKIPAYMVASAQVYERVPEDVRGTTQGRSVDKETVMNIQLKKSHQNVWTGELEGGVGVSFVDDIDDKKVNPYEGRALGLRSGEKSRILVTADGNKSFGCGSSYDSPDFTTCIPTSRANVEMNGLYQINKDSRYQGSLSVDYAEGAEQEHALTSSFSDYSPFDTSLSLDKAGTYVHSLSTKHEFKYSKNDEVLGLLQNPNVYVSASLGLNKNIDRSENREFSYKTIGFISPFIQDSLYSDNASLNLYKYKRKRNSVSVSGYAMASPINNDKIDISLSFGYFYNNQSNDRHYYYKYALGRGDRSYSPYDIYTNSGHVGLDLSFALDDSKKNIIMVGDNLDFSSYDDNDSYYSLSYSRYDDLNNLYLYPLEYTEGIVFREKDCTKRNAMTHNLSLTYSYNNYNQQTGGDVLFKAGIEMPIVNETLKLSSESVLQGSTMTSYDDIQTDFSPFVCYLYKNNKKALEYYLYANFSSDEVSLGTIGKKDGFKNQLTYSLHMYGKKRFNRTFANAYIDYMRYDNRICSYYYYYPGSYLGETRYAQKSGSYTLRFNVDVDVPLASTDVLRLKNTVTAVKRKSVEYEYNDYNKTVTEALRLVFQPSSSFELSAVGTLNYIGIERTLVNDDTDIYDFDYGLAANVELPFGIQFGTDCFMRSTRGYVKEQDNRNAFVLNARLTKRFVKNRLLVQFTGHDLFNNLSVPVVTTMSASRYDMSHIGRNILSYGMMNVTWRF